MYDELRKRGTRKSPLVLGIDIGGTFTDLALVDRETGAVRVGKVLTNYADLAAGVVDGIKDVIGVTAKIAAVPAAAIGQVVHGTTLATNALIERRGARTALIVTRGFRDILEFGRESRFDIYDIDIEVPPPLIERADVFEVTERLDASGNVVTPLVREEVAGIAHEISRRGIAAVAVCLLHAYRNPVHETAIERLIGEAAPAVSVALSSRVMPEIREYERASTTAANAYVQPPLADYLTRLSHALEELGITVPLSLIASDGGTLSVETACRFPVRIVESGPAGGAVATAHIAGAAGIHDVIGFDMGGTTAKFCLIEGGEPVRSTTFEAARVYRFAKGSGLPLKVPVIELIEIGTGGGSIARLDRHGRLQVGPESAGASPGPACYGLGGQDATVTDADLVLGLLDDEHFLGGRMRLERGRAEAAIQRAVAGPLGLSLARAAAGIQAIVNDGMARAAKVHCMERGKDPRKFALLAYGGAGPMHGYGLARTLGIGRMILPPRAGVMSALGFLAAPASFELVRSDATLLTDALPERIYAILTSLEDEGRRLVRSAGVAGDRITIVREAAMRYAGQSFELNVPVPAGYIDEAVLEDVGRAFLDLYQRRYHRLNPGVPLEITGWRVIAYGPRPAFPTLVAAHDRPAQRTPRSRRVYSVERGEMVGCATYDRSQLQPGATIEGPAVVEEDESTAFIDVGGVAKVDASLNLIVTLPTRAASRADQRRRAPA